MAPNRSRCAHASLNSSHDRNQRNEGTNLASKTYKSRVRILCLKSTPFESYAKSGKTLTLAREEREGDPEADAEIEEMKQSTSKNLLDEALGLEEEKNKSGRVFLIEDSVETSCDFVLHHLMKRSLSPDRSGVLLFVALAHPFSHYDRILRKLVPLLSLILSFLCFFFFFWCCC